MSPEAGNRVSARDLRLFALVWFPLLLAVLGLILWSKAGWPAGAVTIWALGLAVGIAGGVRPQSVRPVFLGMLTLTRPIGILVNKFVLTAVYVLLFTPIGMLMRALGYDPMLRKIDRAAGSYWVPHKEDDDVARYFRQS